MTSPKQSVAQGLVPAATPDRDKYSDAQLESFAQTERLQAEAQARINAGRDDNEVGSMP